MYWKQVDVLLKQIKCCSLQILLTSVYFYFAYIQKQLPEVFCNKGVSQNSQQNTCARASCLVQASAWNFINKQTIAQVFFDEFCKNFKNAFFIEYLPWLLLHIYKKVNFSHLDQGMMLFIFRNLNILLQINNLVSLKQVNTLVVPTENSYDTLLMTFV